ncbi:VOC family protein [Gynuella sunshinyii]|uniref:Lactoylglutathione lyase and related lyase n=1 Tax=Gynuella sunshinyii YC6258 TaxID=1445510 RepID=A0A0C5VP31_9GAMM|nr:VOC family protein [Gynuella sunshinyii]AJQ96417.1 lactoylglutathione lyase and related lyase [Gynuella sunshinyii YC6258]
MISHIDHIVITVADIERSIEFYSRVLKLKPVVFGNGRKALSFGQQKINLQLLGQESRNRAAVGSADICLITSEPLTTVMDHIQKEGVSILEGPVDKSGAVGQIQSIYFNDPDDNLIEVSEYISTKC